MTLYSHGWEPVVLLVAWRWSIQNDDEVPTLLNAKASVPEHLRAVLIQIHDRFKSNADYSLEEDKTKWKKPKTQQQRKTQHHLSTPSQKTQTVLKIPKENDRMGGETW